jgi:hypothetical protein
VNRCRVRINSNFDTRVGMLVAGAIPASVTIHGTASLQVRDFLRPTHVAKDVKSVAGLKHLRLPNDLAVVTQIAFQVGPRGCSEKLERSSRGRYTPKLCADRPEEGANTTSLLATLHSLYLRSDKALHARRQLLY